MRLLQSLLLIGLASFAHGQTTTEDPDCIPFVPPTGEPCPTEMGVSSVYPDPNHCSRYWECYDGCAKNLICQEDYLYDDVRKWCNYPDQVVCGDRPCDGRPCAPNPTTLHPYSFICPQANGYFGDPDNCMKYYNCLGWVPTRISCPIAGNGQQELYNVENIYCDYPDRVDCGDRPICDASDGNCYEATTEPPSYCDSIQCPGSGTVWVPQGDCESCVCECSQGVGYEICCGAGLYWNPSVNQCDFDYNNPGC